MTDLRQRLIEVVAKALEDAQHGGYERAWFKYQRTRTHSNFDLKVRIDYEKAAKEAIDALGVELIGWGSTLKPYCRLYPDKAHEFWLPAYRLTGIERESK